MRVAILTTKLPGYEFTNTTAKAERRTLNINESSSNIYLINIQEPRVSHRVVLPP